MTGSTVFTSQVPGKLYLVGEYAVLAPNQPAILLAVDRYLEARFTPSEVPFFHLTNPQAGYPPLLLPLTEVVGPKVGPWRYVQSALQVAQQFLAERGIAIQGGQIDYQSDLIDGQGQKYGFGSSGAVTIATLEAVLSAHRIKLDPLTIYKLAALAHLGLKSQGSFGDIAASTYGGWVYYSPPDREWLTDQVTQQPSIQDLIDRKWPGLVIEPIAFPPDLQVLVGWTQRPASTDRLVEVLADKVQEEASYYQDFLRQAQSIVDRIKTALDHQDIQAVGPGLADYRQALLGLSYHYRVVIETPSLTDLINLAQDFGYYGKSSGAGGGDCGLAVGSDPQALAAIHRAWRNHAIQPLDLAPAAPRYPERSPL